MRSPPRGSRSAVCLPAIRRPAPLRRQRPARQDVDLLPGVAECDLGIQQRLDDPVALLQLRSGTKPVQNAAEVDEANPILADEIALAQGRGRSDRLVERSRAAASRIGEAVEEDDHVGVPLGMELVDPEVAAARAGAPVDSPDPVAGGERPQIRELETLALLPRDAVAGEELRLTRSDQLAQLLGSRVDAKRFCPVERLLP